MRMRKKVRSIYRNIFFLCSIISQSKFPAVQCSVTFKKFMLYDFLCWRTKGLAVRADERQRNLFFRLKSVSKIREVNDVDIDLHVDE